VFHKVPFSFLRSFFSLLIARVCLETTFIETSPFSLLWIGFMMENLKQRDRVVCAEIGFLAPFLVVATIVANQCNIPALMALLVWLHSIRRWSRHAMKE
jgi:hypothetical protein